MNASAPPAYYQGTDNLPPPYYSQPPPGTYAPHYAPSYQQQHPAGYVHQHQPTKVVYVERDQRDKDRQDATDCLLLGACCALLCCCLVDGGL